MTGRHRSGGSASGRQPGGELGGLRWRPSVLSSDDSLGWSSREEQARAARLDREIDAQNLGRRSAGPTPRPSASTTARPSAGTTARTSAGTSGSTAAGTTGTPSAGTTARPSAGTSGAARERDWSGRPIEPAGEQGLDELSGALAVAAGLRLLMDECPEAPEEGLLALRAATSALHGRGPWRAMPPAARLAMSGAGAVAAAVIGAAAWAGVNSYSSGPEGIRTATLTAAVSQLRQAGVQLSQAKQALADGDQAKATQLLQQAQLTTSIVAAQVSSTAQPPASTGNSGSSGSLAAQLLQEQKTVASLQDTIDSYQAANDATATTAGGPASSPSSSPPTTGKSSPGTSSPVTSLPPGILPVVLGSTGTANCATTPTTQVPPTTSTTQPAPATTLPSTTTTLGLPVIGTSQSSSSGTPTSETGLGGLELVTPVGTPASTATTGSTTTSSTTTTTESVTSSTTCPGSDLTSAISGSTTTTSAGTHLPSS